MSAEILDHSDVERTLARKWKRATTEWELIRIIVDYFRIAPTPGSARTGKSLQ